MPPTSWYFLECQSFHSSQWWSSCGSRLGADRAAHRQRDSTTMGSMISSCCDEKNKQQSQVQTVAVVKVNHYWTQTHGDVMRFGKRPSPQVDDGTRSPTDGLFVEQNCPITPHDSCEDGSRHSRWGVERGESFLDRTARKHGQNVKQTNKQKNNNPGYFMSVEKAQKKSGVGSSDVSPPLSGAETWPDSLPPTVKCFVLFAVTGCTRGAAPTHPASASKPRGRKKKIKTRNR